MSRPNQPDDDFEAQLRVALGEHADAAQHVDLADGALSKARGIRRRRVALSTVAVLATVAIAIPVGGQLVGDADRDGDHLASDPTTDVGTAPTPDPVQIALDGLPQGDPPSVPYIDGSTYVDASGDEHPADAADDTVITDAATLADGTLLWQQVVGDATKTTVKVSGDGPTDLPAAASVTPPAIDQGTKAAVFALHDTDASGQPATSDTIVYATAVKGGTASVDTVDTGMRVRQVMGAFNGRVVFNAVEKGNGEVVALVAMADDPSDVTTPWENLKTVTAVSPDESLLAGLPSRGNFEPGQRHCSLMLDAAEMATIWTDCDWNPVEFSADGSRVLALPTQRRRLRADCARGSRHTNRRGASRSSERAAPSLERRSTAPPTPSSQSSWKAASRRSSGARSTAPSVSSRQRRPRSRPTSPFLSFGLTS